MNKFQEIIESILRGVVDTVSGGFIFVSSAHSEIHGDNSFHVCVKNTTANTDLHRTAIGFTTPNTLKYPHLVTTLISSAAIEFEILEAPTIDDDAGSQVTILNRNRNSSGTSGILSLETTPVVNQVTKLIEANIAGGSLSGGTQLEYTTLAGGQGAFVLGGTERGQQEWLLKQNTKYLLIMKNVGANANAHTIIMDWYERTDNT